MFFRKVTIWATAALAAGPICRAEEGVPEGMLVQRVLVAAYLQEGPQRAHRRLLIEREVRQFEALVWHHSGRKVRVESVLVQAGRSVSEEDLTAYSEVWGYALTRSARVKQDLKLAGADPSQFDGLLLLFDPLPTRPCQAAGLTWHSERYSSIPLKRNLFREYGHRYPLHLVMAHEYLHQLDSAFEQAGSAEGFGDPDRIAEIPGTACVLPGDPYPHFRTALQHDELCRPTDWRALDGLMGSWVTR
jgi:hypothetical protein